MKLSKDRAGTNPSLQLHTNSARPVARCYPTLTNVIASPNFLHFFDTVPTSPIIGAINSTFNGGAAIGALQGGLTMRTSDYDSNGRLD
ncbi:hypothetical protein VTO42DRAFT_7736 [Malbranchea cinnamomea]